MTIATQQKVLADFLIAMEAWDDDAECNIYAVYALPYEVALERDIYEAKVAATIVSYEDPNDLSKPLCVVQPKQEFHYTNGKEQAVYVMTMDELVALSSGVNKIHCSLPKEVGVKDTIGYLYPFTNHDDNICNIAEENIRLVGCMARMRSTKKLQSFKYAKYVTGINDFFTDAHERSMLISHIAQLIAKEK